MQRKRFILIDANSLIHRAYHALPSLTTKKGEPVNAVYGFLLVFLKTVKDLHPDYIAACFDFPAKTFRHKEYKEYKAKRPKMPDDLRRQIPKIKEFLKVFSVPVFEKKGLEADDIIASLKTGASSGAKKIKNIIISGDLDLLQLVDKNTKVYFLRRGVKETIFYDEKKVEEKYQGLKPEQLSDFRGLRGDPSDNIPGVLGVGEKTAIKLIKEFGSLENLYSELDRRPPSEKVLEIANQRLRAKLKEHKSQAFLSKKLAQIKKDAPLDFSLEKCFWKKYDKKKAIQLFENFDFYSLIKKLPDFEREEKPIEEGKQVLPVKKNLQLW